ncbi:MAG: hypothetical protein EA395_05530 [Phormidium sp. GEM2.Bin31]|nr:MAG: hypothetical protein EA395_05530 [Phormidium sp. GEM2.Bin31]
MRQCWTIPTLPLAVYREVVAHLRQVEGVAAGLLPQTAPHFDPKLSQVGGLWLEIPDNAPADHQNRLNTILQYYGDRAQQSWQPLEAEA